MVPAIRTVTASRFARDILVQKTGWRFLRGRGIDLIASDSPGAFLDETPTAIMIRQLLGVISEFEKASLVAKMHGARQRKKRATGKCQGRKSIAELRPDVVALARDLRRRRSKPTLARHRGYAGGARPTGRIGKAVRTVGGRGCCAVNRERPAKCLGAEGRSGIEWTGSAFSPREPGSHISRGRYWRRR